MTSRTPSGRSSRKSSTAATRDRTKGRAPLRLEALEARDVPARTIAVDFDGATRSELNDTLGTLLGWRAPNSLEANAMDPSSFVGEFANLAPDLESYVTFSFLDLDGDFDLDRADGDLAAEEILDRVRAHFLRYDVRVVRRDDSVTAAFDLFWNGVIGDALIFAFGWDGQGGQAPLEAGNRRDDVGEAGGSVGIARGVVADGRTGAAAREAFFNQMANFISHEAAHTFGVDHINEVLQPQAQDVDLMTPLIGGGELKFRDVTFVVETLGTQNAHRVLYDALGPRDSITHQPFSGLLKIVGDKLRNTPNDVISLDVEGSDLVVRVNALPPRRFPLAQVTSIVVEGRDGEDTLRVEANGGIPTFLDGGSGGDTVQLGFARKNLGPITGATRVAGGTESDRLVVEDSANTNGAAYAVGSGRLDRPGFGGLSYAADVEGLTLWTGRGASDTVNVLSTEYATPIDVFNGGGHDTVHIGNAGNGVGSIGGTVNVRKGVPRSTTLYVDNTAGFGRDARLLINPNNAAFGSLSGLAPVPITYDPAGLDGLTVAGGLDSTRFVVDGTGYGYTTTLTGRGNADAVVVRATGGPLAFNGGGGLDAVVIGDRAVTFRPSVPGGGIYGVRQIFGSVTVDNPDGLIDLTVDNRPDANSHGAVVITNRAITGLTSGGSAINYRAELLNSLTVYGGDGTNTFDISGLTFAANLVGGSRTDRLVSTNNFDFNLGDTVLRRRKEINGGILFYGDVQLTSIESAALTGGSDANKFWFESWGGQITLNGGGGADRLLLDDALTAASTAYTVYDNRVTYPRNGRTVTVNYFNFADLAINGGGSPSTFDVESTSAATTINPGPGGGDVRVAPAGRTLDQLRGPLTVNGSGVTTLSVNDRDAAAVVQGNLITHASYFTQTDRQLALQRIRFGTTGIPTITSAQVTYQNVAGLTVVAPRQTPNTVLSVLNTGGTTRTILDTTAGAAAVFVGSSTTSPDAVGNVLILGSPSTSVVIDDTATVPAFNPMFGYNHKPTYLLGDGTIARTNVVTYSFPQFSFSSVTTYRTAINYGNIGSLEVRGGSTGNVFDVQVQGAANRHQTTLKAGAGGDIVNAGGPDTGLDYVDRLTVVGNTGAVLNLNDQPTGYREFPTNSGTRTWSPKPTFRVTNGAVVRTNVVTTNFVEFNFPGQQTFNTSISYSALPGLVLNGGSNGNVFNVQYTAAGTPVVINAGAGDDVTNLGAGNFMDGIQGPVTVNGQGGTNEVNLNDRGQQEGMGYVIGPDTVVRQGLSPFLGFQDVQKLVLSTGRAADFVRVTGTTATTDVTVNAGGGNDDVFLGTGGNTLDQILRPVAVNGQAGADRLVLQDDLSTADHPYRVANNSVDRDAGGVATYTGVENLTLDAGKGNNLIFVTSTAAGTTTTLNGGDGNDAFINQGPAGNLDDIRGPLALHGQGGDHDYPILYDHYSPVGRTYTLTADRVRRTGMADITFDSMIQLIVYTGHAVPDIVNIESVAEGVFTPVVVGLGDVVTVGKPVAGGRTLQEIRGSVRPQAIDDQPVTVVLDNRADLEPRTSTFTFNPAGANQLDNYIVGLTPKPIYFMLSPTSSLTVRGGTGADTFRLPGTPAGTLLSLEGGGGAGRNTLDYSASTADVAVNLRTATATGLAAFTGIQNVTGGAGADVLVGTGGNALQGGPGSDILIGGPLASTLLGGTGEDVLVGGTTAHDLAPAALAALQAEWARTDLPFSARVHDLTRGGGLNGSTVLAPATFTPNGLVNTLTGAAPADLFFGLRSLDADDWNPDQGDVFIERTTVLGGTLIDARPLDIGSFTLDNVSFDATTPFTRTLTPGSHFVNTPYHGPAVFFTVAADGTTDYDPALEGVLTGRGTANLGINGRAVTLDAVALDAPFLHLDNGTFDATAPLTRRLLPGQHFVNMPYNNPVLHFTVANDGTVDYAAALDGVFSGRGTTGLVITGRTVTLDARALDVASLHLDNVPYDATAPLTRQLLPGQHFVNTPYNGPVVYFTVADDGTVDYAPALDGVFTGRGTTSLGINGREVRIDAGALDVSSLHLDNVSYASTVLTRRLLPGQHFLNTPYHGPAVYFTVAADGTVDYDAALDGVFTGRGTSDLGVIGRSVTIDARALGVATLFVDNVSYAAQDPLTRQLLPGQHFVTVTGVTYYFTVANDGAIDYAAELDNVLSGRGTTTLLFLNP